MRLRSPFAALALLLLPISLVAGSSQAVTFESAVVADGPCSTHFYCVEVEWSISGDEAGVAGSFPLPFPAPAPDLWMPVSARLTGSGGASYSNTFSSQEVLAYNDPFPGQYFVGTVLTFYLVLDTGSGVLGGGSAVMSPMCFDVPGSITTGCSDGNAGTSFDHSFGVDQLAWTQEPIHIAYEYDLSNLQVAPLDPSANSGGLFASGVVSVVYARVPGTEPLPVNVDVRSFRNRNLIVAKPRIPIPVVLLGSETLDVRAVDVATLAFGPDSAAPIFDLTNRLIYRFSLFDVNHDGFDDLFSVYFYEDTGLPLGESEACLDGEIDGRAFEGCNTVNVFMPACGLGFELALLLPPLMWLRPRRRRAA